MPRIIPLLIQRGGETVTIGQATVSDDGETVTGVINEGENMDCLNALSVGASSDLLGKPIVRE